MPTDCGTTYTKTAANLEGSGQCPISSDHNHKRCRCPKRINGVLGSDGLHPS